MLCLGIESTAHTFGIGIISDKGKVFVNVKSVYVPPKGWGIEPVKAAEHHEIIAKPTFEKAMKESGIGMEDIGLVAFSKGPGLPHCLYKGLNFAREIANEYKKPLIGANHCIAHIEIGKLKTKCKDPVTLYVSGGNTQVIAFVSGKYRVFGETQDIGIGNALDKLGRELGLGFPAGPEIEKLAENGKWTELPYTVKGMDLNFSGILSECMRKYKNGEKIEDLCFSFQETCFTMLTEVTERALAHTGKNEALLTGGVAANKRLQEMFETMCRERGAEFFVCPKEFASDNGLMIAWAGILAYKSGMKTKSEILPRQRTDDVNVSWIV